MGSIAQINETQVSVINFKSIPVVTTDMLAEFYNTDTNNIRQNYTRNKARFIEGKHFFKVVGDELKKFVDDLKSFANSTTQISPKTRNLILWTERGAARHAKMLDTDQAWDIFEQLEDCYFAVQEVVKQHIKTTKKERVPLKDAVNMLVGKAKFLNYSDAYKLVHQRFNVEHIEDIPHEQIPSAVEYVHCLLGEYIPREEVEEQKALPYPQEVIQVAQQISNEFNNSRYDSWHVSARNGVLTAMPLPPGFYPTMDIAEFTKRFDSVLDLLYGTDTLRVGRHFLRERNSK
ncbi:ORF6N domain-containing protein [Acinetobacter schindleri]|uniref:ORF6N domain-containing protein n=1 Tax=Acinetobacter schindleri TaxID=108981 RepID=UPI0021CDB895|nr:ORF6N domain-containing protein [Acinetobacter schindleri]MCU4518631.1 ORF6N domain-containing protein [Acinetobacter schindleri]